jgi:hypothetical protein
LSCPDFIKFSSSSFVIDLSGRWVFRAGPGAAGRGEAEGREAPAAATWGRGGPLRAPPESRRLSPPASGRRPMDEEGGGPGLTRGVIVRMPADDM